MAMCREALGGGLRQRGEEDLILIQVFSFLNLNPISRKFMSRIKLRKLSSISVDLRLLKAIELIVRESLAHFFHNSNDIYN